MRLVDPKNHRRILWSIADSAVSSASNVLLAFAVAHFATTLVFGFFSLSFSAYLLLLGQSRAASTDALLVRSVALAGLGRRSWSRAVVSATGASVIVGCLGGGVIAIVASVVEAASHHDGSAGHPFLIAFVMAMGLPVLFLQDAWRNVHFANRDPFLALLNDAVWTTSFIFVLCILAAVHHLTPVGAELAWIGGAGLAAAFGCWQLDRIPKLRDGADWWISNRRLTFRYAGDNLLSGGIQQISTYLVALLAGVSAAGALRGVITLVGPFTTLLVGINTFLLPWFVTRWSSAEPRLARLGIRASALIAVLACAAGIAMMALPSFVGRLMLGATWAEARPLLFASIIWTLGLAFVQGPSVAIRAMGLASHGLKVRVASSIFIVGGVSLGSVLAGAAGAAWGMAIATCGGAVIWMIAVAVLEKKHAEAVMSRST